MIELMRALDPILEDWKLAAGDNDNELLMAEQGEAWLKSRIVDYPLKNSGARWSRRIRNEMWFVKLTSSDSVIHRSYHAMHDGLPNRTPVIETLHDLWDHVGGQPWNSYVEIRKYLKKRALHRADHIICVSEATRRQLEDLWPNLAQRATVIHHGVRPLPLAEEAGPYDRPYFLYVGRRDLYKNFNVLLRALSADFHLNDTQLVCFGGSEFSPHERKAIVAAGLWDRVQQVSGDDVLLGQLYRKARALLYPSKHEGFGLPILEAMISECPVITTPCTALPEVAGDAAIYCAPDDVDSWIEAMNRMHFDNDFSGSLIEAGRKQAERFSWRASAEAHRELYRRFSV